MDRSAIIDIQCVRSNNKSFIVKELAVVSITHLGVQSVLSFQPPCRREELSQAVQREICWVERNLHFIKFEEGLYPYNTLGLFATTLTHPFKYIFAKGVEKASFLEDLLQHPVTPLEEYDCPGLNDLPSDIYCNFHKTNRGVCALRNASALVNWFSEHPKRLLCA